MATEVLPKSDSGWIATPSGVNVAVGLKGANAEVTFHLGDEDFSYSAGRRAGDTLILAKAEGVKIVNPSKTHSAWYEILL